MMKKGLYAILAALAVFALVMTGCDTGGGDTKKPDPVVPGGNFTVTFVANKGTPAPAAQTVAKDALASEPQINRRGYTLEGWYDNPGFSGTKWTFTTSKVTANVTLHARWVESAQANNVVRFKYTNEDILDIPFVANETTWGDILSNKTFTLSGGNDRWEADAKVFKDWQDQTNAVWNDGAAVIQAKLTLTPTWYNNTLTNDNTAVEKLSLENAGKAIYEFNLGAETFTDYDLYVTYKITEFALNVNQTQLRITQIREEELTTANYDSDPQIANMGYKLDANQVKFLDNNQHNNGNRFVSNGGRDKALNGSDIQAAQVDTSNVIQADTWFTIKYPISAPPGDANWGSVPFPTTGKIYLGLGLSTNSQGRDPNYYSPTFGNKHSYNLQLVKDIKLVHKTDAAKAAIIASIPAATLPQYQAYADPASQVFCWRGAPGAAVATPPEKPKPVVTAPIAENNHEVSFTGKTLTLYQTDTNTDGTKVVTITGNTINFNLTADNGGWNPGNSGDAGGKFGGGGFIIKFSDLNLPEIEGEKDYRSYGTIEINCTAANLEGSASNPNQVNFRIPGSNSNLSVANNSAAANGYVAVVAGANVFKIPTTSIIFADDAEDDDIGIVLLPNNWASSNLPWKGDITVNSVKFVAY